MLVGQAKNPDTPFETMALSTDRYKGASYQKHLLEQYKLYVQMANHVSERRTALGASIFAAQQSVMTGLTFL